MFTLTAITASPSLPFLLLFLIITSLRIHELPWLQYLSIPHHVHVDMRYVRVVRRENLTEDEHRTFAIQRILKLLAARHDGCPIVGELDHLIEQAGYLFFHPAHRAPMKPVEQSYGWTCIGTALNLNLLALGCSGLLSKIHPLFPPWLPQPPAPL